MGGLEESPGPGGWGWWRSSSSYRRALRLIARWRRCSPKEGHSPWEKLRALLPQRGQDQEERLWEEPPRAC